MSNIKREPPRLASWLLQRVRPHGDDSGALAGDIVESFREGKTGAWFWRQVLIAYWESSFAGIRNRWPLYSYAIAGTIMPAFLSELARSSSRILPWWAVPWPLSQLIFEQLPVAMLALAALPALGVALLINGEFRWASIFRTGLTNLVLLILVFYALLPLIARPLPGNPYVRTVAIPGVLQMIGFGFLFLMSASLGCRGSRPKTTAKV